MNVDPAKANDRRTYLPSLPPPPSQIEPIMTVKGGGGRPACAVCKFQRRKCSKDCQLAQYFPADNTEQFASVHKLFGVSNILKVLNQISDPVDRSTAMRTMIYEANTWKRIPHLGCLYEIQCLQYEIFVISRELEGVLREIRSLQQQQQQSMNCSPSSSSHLQLSIHQSSDNVNISYNEIPSFVVENNSDINFLSAYYRQQRQQPSYNGDRNDGDGEVMANCDRDINPDIADLSADDHPEFDNYNVDSKEAFGSSSPNRSMGEGTVSLKMEDKQRNYELESAAAGFSLTNKHTVLDS